MLFIATAEFTVAVRRPRNPVSLRELTPSRRLLTKRFALAWLIAVALVVLTLQGDLVRGSRASRVSTTLAAEKPAPPPAEKPTPLPVVAAPPPRTPRTDTPASRRSAPTRTAEVRANRVTAGNRTAGRPDVTRLPRRRLNVLLMVADDLQSSDLGIGFTPHLDALSRSGVTFADAHTPAPLCTPSRYVILSGRYASCHFCGVAARNVNQISLNGVMSDSAELQSIDFNINLPDAPRRLPPGPAGGVKGAGATGVAGSRRCASGGLEGNRSAWRGAAALASGGAAPAGEAHDTGGMATTAAATAAPCSVVTLAELLRRRGWSTGFVGKWHLGYPASRLSAAERRRVQQASVREWRDVRSVVLAEYHSIKAHVRRCGFEQAERVYVNNLYAEQHVLPQGMLHHNVEWLADGAAKFVRMAANRERPFFLYLAWTLPHNPDAESSLLSDPRLTPGGMWALDGEWNRTAVLAARAAVRRLATPPGGKRQGRLGHQHYPLALAWMDSGVGMVLDALRASRVDNGTLTVFTSDHQSYDKRHCYTGGSRVPLFFAWPTQIRPQPAAVPHLVSHLDLMPTLLHAVLGPAATSAAVESLLLPGLSLLGLLQSDEQGAPQQRAALPARSGGAAYSVADATTAAWLLSSVTRPAAAGYNGSEGARVLFCEVGQSRAVFTQQLRLIYAPQIKPIAKGGSTDLRQNYQAHRHHRAYWRPLQLYDLLADPEEQRNVIEDPAYRPQLVRFRALLRAQLDACTWDHGHGAPET